MRSGVRLSLILLLLLARAAVAAPKLVVVIVVDQLRYDYLTRFRSEYTGGLDQLLRRGAVFTNAHFEHFPTVTAVGHATILSGAPPSLSGIVANEWYDRESGKRVTSVADPQEKLVGTAVGAGASPRRLLVSTVADELKMAHPGKPRAIGISLKDRGAILTVGRMADAAYWFDDQSGAFVSSTYYFSDLPGWVKDFNASGIVRRYAGAEWRALANGNLLLKLPDAPGVPLYRAMESSPFGNELLLEFAQRAVEAEQLGSRDATDVLSVSFSSNDYVGHQSGPDSPEVRDITVRTDRILDRFLRFLDQRVGLANALVVLTSDHGVAPLPETQAARKMPGGRLAEKTLRSAAEQALASRYGAGNWVLDFLNGSVYLNTELLREKGLNPAEVQEAAAKALARVPQVARVYTRAQLETGRLVMDQVDRRVANGFHRRRSGDVIVVLEPYWIPSARGTTHGSPYSYDSHVPVVFMGPGVRPGYYHRPAAVNDIAPTLATLLEVETPSGSVGRVLEEMLAPVAGPRPAVRPRAAAPPTNR
ncbi:MAG: alkaline phosphatase family protein [Bryobacterales bacterium]|nr:alkaline phosphatase family protein [Bryobacterales bacterium]